MSRLAQLTHFHDRAEAQKITKAAYALNRSVTRPLEALSYERLSTVNEAQAVSAIRYLRTRRLEHQDRIFFATDVKEDLAFKRVPYKRFEEAVRQLGLAIRPGHRLYHEYWFAPGSEEFPASTLRL